MGLLTDPDVPVIGIVTRLADQKGVQNYLRHLWQCVQHM